MYTFFQAMSFHKDYGRQLSGRDGMDAPAIGYDFPWQ